MHEDNEKMIDDSEEEEDLNDFSYDSDLSNKMIEKNYRDLKQAKVNFLNDSKKNM